MSVQRHSSGGTVRARPVDNMPACTSLVCEPRLIFEAATSAFDPLTEEQITNTGCDISVRASRRPVAVQASEG